MPRQQVPGEQIEKAKTLAAAMTKLRDREWFERDASIISVKSDYQREIDGSLTSRARHARLVRLTEAQPIAERVAHLHHALSPIGIL